MVGTLRSVHPTVLLRNPKNLLDPLFAGLPHRSDTKSLVDGNWIGEDLRFNPAECIIDDIGFGLRQRHPAGDVRGVWHRSPDCAPVWMRLHLDQLESLQLAVETDGEPHHFEAPSVCRGL